MNRRPSWDEHFMLLSEAVSLRSNCLTRRIGAVLVRDLHVISTAYNDTPASTPNCHDGGCQRCSDRAAGRIRSGIIYTNTPTPHQPTWIRLWRNRTRSVRRATRRSPRGKELPP